MKIINNKKYYTVKELADILKISRVSVFNRIKKGQIKAEKIGNIYIIAAEDAGVMLNNDLTEQLKEEIAKGVLKVINEYGGTLKLLGKE
ncbi:MAG: helix-turn-helix domain-containing protein [Patescibacteria group bacterium]|jgi:excisionase family DNA binding protein